VGCAEHKAHDRPEGRRHRWPDEVQSGGGGLVVAPDRWGGGHGPQRGPEPVIEEPEPGQVGAVTGGGDDMVGRHIATLPPGGDGQAYPATGWLGPGDAVTGQHGELSLDPAAQPVSPGRAQCRPRAVDPGRPGQVPEQVGVGVQPGVPAGAETGLGFGEPLQQRAVSRERLAGPGQPLRPGEHPDSGAPLMEKRRQFQPGLARPHHDHFLAAERRRVGVRGTVRAQRRRQ
jgi:hypothetical protein